ncbi:DUF2026 family protein [Hylemonella gracilis]|uniref:DUF2026 domain-containing protein n=1 Tax=Hylemonella gracilis ATCC 19624 TaxID=887062 RepID=F3KX27_9BURK|nr:DUF2026 family protein [Hylemonella gracilis]EGI75814.1 hypothetical protein HGR_15079 [Hylemonella gracilis ATCC 19624]
MAQRPLLPLADYQRIYQVIYSVLEASGLAKTSRACLFFASAGVLILRDHYHLEAMISVGSMALMVHEPTATVLIYGREQDGRWQYDEDGFHAWVECDGWLIDFMAPIMGQAFKEDGAAVPIPRRMLQKPLADRKPHPKAIQHEGEFFYESDSSVAEALLDDQSILFDDLVKICLQWFRRPPKALPPIAMGGTGISDPQPIVLRAPSITGVW